MKRKKVLSEADRLIATDRQDAYGTPYLNHLRIAQLWSAYLEKEITPEQVAMCQVLVKVARSMESFKEDNFVDGAAYFAIACELADIALRQDKPLTSDYRPK
jgi:hypothetical protein